MNRQAEINIVLCRGEKRHVTKIFGFGETDEEAIDDLFKSYLLMKPSWDAIHTSNKIWCVNDGAYWTVGKEGSTSYDFISEYLNR